MAKWINLNDLSTYRSEMMGFAILYIVLYHFCGRGGITFVDKVLGFLFSQGYIGVDIFMVVSGLGLTYSLLKNENLKNYYIKRWVRVFPIFTFITLIECWIIRGESFGLALLRSTTLGYWFGFPYIDWYIPALVGLYVIFPAIFHLVVKPRRFWLALSIGIVCFVAGILIAEYNWMDWKHMAFVYRIPDFLMGCMAAVVIKDGYNQRIIIRYILFLVIIGIIIHISGIGKHYNLWYVNLCFTPFYLSVLCWVFSKLNTLFGGKYAISIFAFMGLFTLEWYRISSSFERLLTNEACPDYHYLYVFIYLTLSLISSYLTYLLFFKN